MENSEKGEIGSKPFGSDLPRLTYLEGPEEPWYRGFRTASLAPAGAESM